MSTAERMREVRALKKRGEFVPTERAPWLPWPREDADGTPIGVDLAAHAGTVREVVRKYFRAPAGVDIDDYCQEVCLKVARRNHMPSAHDPRKSSLLHYLYMIANATGADLANAESRRAADVSLQGAAGAVGPDVPRLEDFVASPAVDDLASDAELALNSLAVRGAIGPTARSYAMDCLAGLPTAPHGSVWKRSALRAEIAEAVGAVGAR